MTIPKGFVVLTAADTYKRINQLRNQLDNFIVCDEVAKRSKRQLERHLLLHCQIAQEREQHGRSLTAERINADKVIRNLTRALCCL